MLIIHILMVRWLEHTMERSRTVFIANINSFLNAVSSWVSLIGWKWLGHDMRWTSQSTLFWAVESSQVKKKTTWMQHKRARIAFMHGTFSIHLVIGVFSSVCIATQRQAVSIFFFFYSNVGACASAECTTCNMSREEMLISSVSIFTIGSRSHSSPFCSFSKNDTLLLGGQRLPSSTCAVCPTVSAHELAHNHS